MSGLEQALAPGALALGGLAAIYGFEKLRPLRMELEPKFRRNARNLAVAGLSAATVQALERPLVMPLAALAQLRGWGLLGLFELPLWAKTLLACALLDYTLYLWHILTHKTAFLWRFHRVHHADLDMDASTALRFHFGEIALSVPWRMTQIAVIGVSPEALLLWQKVVLAAILFHHSNLRLPVALERWLGLLLVTPRLHGIHHSTVADERDSNWSSGLTLWDRLHGTLRLEVPQAKIIIGVPELRESVDVRLSRLLLLPFGARPPMKPDPLSRPTAELGPAGALAP